MRPARQDGRMASPLISADELQALLGSVTVLDVRYRMGGPGGLAEFDRRARARGGVRRPRHRPRGAARARAAGTRCPATEVFEDAMRQAGVRDDRPVVVYDDWSGLAAGRAWWLLRYHGHPDVRVLDGAWPAWRRGRGSRAGGRGDRRTR